MYSDCSQSVRGYIQTIIILAVFWFLFYLFHLLEGPVHSFIANKLILEAEYTVDEQLTKYYLFVTMLISVISYQYEDQEIGIKLSISYLISGFILYMAESNFIVEMAQPIFGVCIVIILCTFLLQAHKYLSLVLIIAGFAFIAGGALADLVHEHEAMKSRLPAFFYQLLFAIDEERFDVIGVGFFCLSAIIAFYIPLFNLVKKNKAIVFILIPSALITVGNGFIHHQYDPSNELHLRALLMTIVGYLGLLIINKKTSILSLFTKEYFNIFIFIFFVLLPGIHGRQRISVSLMIWFPMMVIMALSLWHHHPRNKVV